MQDIDDAQDCAGLPRTPGCAPGSLSPSCPYAKHDPPYDPTWVSNFAQELALLHKYYGDDRPMSAGGMKRGDMGHDWLRIQGT